MNAKIIGGKEIAEKLTADTGKRVSNRVNSGLSRPGLGVILVGDDPASQIYVRNKKLACEKVGIASYEYKRRANISEADLLTLIQQLNDDDRIDGVLVQLPLPAHISEENVIDAILPEKDVDGFHPYNAGRLMLGSPVFRPCTPQGIMRLLEAAGIDIAGMDAVIVGRSNIVGRPMAFELLAKNCTPRICHSHTKNLPAQIQQADIVVAAIGKPKFIQADWIKPGAIVIDVGINRLDNGQLAGDVDFQAAQSVAGYITPVPGGVGPMTIACLLMNTLQAAENKNE